jgi:ABC-type protease/lipase transport system fused ATPase/permease subunit
MSCGISGCLLQIGKRSLTKLLLGDIHPMAGFLSLDCRSLPALTRRALVARFGRSPIAQPVSDFRFAGCNALNTVADDIGDLSDLANQRLQACRR